MMQQHTFKTFNRHGVHHLTYYEWGDPTNSRVLLCVHGLFRNGRDFDWLASALAPYYRIICPDMPGRGLSDNFKSSGSYTIKNYITVLLNLLMRLRIPQVDFLGTSMGGLIGMAMATLPLPPIHRLIINDVGPEIPLPALINIAHYGEAGAHLVFHHISAVIDYLKKTYPSFLGISDADWQQLARHAVITHSPHAFRLAYDPQILWNVKIAIKHPVTAWPLFSSIRCPLLLLQGENSTLLTPDIVARMQTLQPRMTVKSFPDIGHPVSLMLPHEIQYLIDWLLP